MSILLPFIPAIALLVFALTFVVLVLRFQQGRPVPALRPLPALDSLQNLAERSIEEGRATHVALGTGRLDNRYAAETVVALVVADHLTAQARRANVMPVVTTADPTSQLVGADILTQGDVRLGWQTRGASRFVAPLPMAYGAQTRGMMQRESLGLTAAVGDFGDDYLFIAAQQPGGGTPFYNPELAATARLETMPLVQLTTPNPVIGEETYALGAYLGQEPAHWASLVLQDVARLMMALVIIIGVVVASLRAAGVF